MGPMAPPTCTHNNKARNNNTLGGILKDRSSLTVLSRILGLWKTITMVDAFCATWKLVESENFDDYMKALGQ